MGFQQNEALNKTNDKVQSDNAPEAFGLIANPHVQVLCCSGTACYGSGSLKIIDKLIHAIADHGLGSQVDVVATGCFGFCAKGPIVRIMPDNTTYVQVKPEDVEEIIQSHIIDGKQVDRLLYIESTAHQLLDDVKHWNSPRHVSLDAMLNDYI